MSRPEHGFDLLRVYLGVGLLVRGALFARNPALLDQFINSDDWLFPMFLAHSLVLAHVVGGLLLSLGCCTRFAAAMQIPFVAGALFLVHWDEGLLATTQSFEFAALVLVALAVYAVCGAGRLSVDNWMQRTPPEVATGEPALGLQREILDRHASTSRESELVLASPQASALLGDALPKDPPYAREEYRDVKHELVIVLVSMGVLFVLLARGLYLLAPVWLIATLVVFVVWRVGQAPLD